MLLWNKTYSCTSCMKCMVSPGRDDSFLTHFFHHIYFWVCIGPTATASYHSLWSSTGTLALQGNKDVLLKAQKQKLATYLDANLVDIPRIMEYNQVEQSKEHTCFPAGPLLTFLISSLICAPHRSSSQDSVYTETERDPCRLLCSFPPWMLKRFPIFMIKNSAL